MSLTLVLFLIGILGFVFNRKNIILMLISIEIMLLSITFLILVSSINLDDIIGQTYAVYIIVIAGAESAIGLAILVAFYRLASCNAFSCSNTTYSSFRKSLNRVSESPCEARARKKIIKAPNTFIINYSTLKEACLHP
jgi:NADH-ubiquinone oxidoreductase chain 4L